MLCMLAGALLAILAMSVRSGWWSSGPDLLAAELHDRSAAFDRLRQRGWDRQAIDRLEHAALRTSTVEAVELAQRILGPGGPGAERLGDDPRLHLAGMILTSDTNLPHVHTRMLAGDLLAARISECNDHRAERLRELVRHVLDRASAGERHDRDEDRRLLLHLLALLGQGPAHLTAPLATLDAPPHRSDLGRTLDLAMSWRLSPGGTGRATLEPAVPALTSSMTPAARAARYYREARARGPEGPVHANIRRAAETDHPEPALLTILAAHGGEEAAELLQRLTRSERIYRGARRALGGLRVEMRQQDARSILHTARMPLGMRCVAAMDLLETITDPAERANLTRSVLIPDAPAFLADDDGAILPAVLLAERGLEPDDRRALCAEWSSSFNHATQQAAALLLLFDNGPVDSIEALLDVATDPAHRSLLRLARDGLHARHGSLSADAHHFALRALRRVPGERTISWRGNDPFSPQRVAAAAAAGADGALDAIVTLPDAPDPGDVAWRVLLLARLIPEIPRAFGTPVSDDAEGTILWFDAASIWLVMARHTRTFDPATRTWSTGLIDRAPAAASLPPAAPHP